MPITITYINDDIDDIISFTEIINRNLVSKIDCTDNELISLPDNMNFPNLQYFICYGNQLTALPAFGTNMNFPNLIDFTCNNNK